MPIDSDLQAAGRRAAEHPVPAAPSIAALEAGAAKHTSRRRRLVSGAAVVVLIALAFPLALTMRGSTTVQTVAVGTGQAAAAQVDPAPPTAQGDAEDEEPTAPELDEGVRIQLRSGDDFAVAIRVLDGPQAVAAADQAASAATETIDVDGVTAWIGGIGDERTVSALVEADQFVEVTGAAEQLDFLIDVLRDGRRGERQGIRGFDNLDEDDWQQFFDQFENGEFSFDIDGLDLDGLDSDEFLKDFDGQFDFDGDFDGFQQFFGPNGEFNFDGDFDGFQQFFGPNGEFNFDLDDFSLDGDFGQLFGADGFTFPNESFGEGFDGCIVIEHADSTTGEPVRIEFPDGCGSTG